MKQFALHALLTVMLLSSFLHAQETYVLGPDSLPQAGVAKGSVTKYELQTGQLG